jgi:nucleotide-binding universal stress UspA family protein
MTKMINRILVPVDFSDPSLQALDYAIEFGRPFKAELIVLHVVESAYYPLVADAFVAGYDMGLVQRELERAGREQLARLATRLEKRRLAVRTLLSIGAASPVIVATAKKLGADLIIMSTHGRTGLSHVLMGSVAERVVRSAACPVLTVRARKAVRRSRPRRSSPARRSAGRPSR